ncbi:dual oxidase maturation factor 2-like [Brienomyrus brachyistius]|uniref:dual oxidase maturation factor 2-like n=1 Tax=Brienomyrus brachyistius TaxID=42636 RepID=UPI0020B3C7C7|nr:dual oxidase maturation factor 2-like [Brienomyrus brachyistius]
MSELHSAHVLNNHVFDPDLLTVILVFSVLATAFLLIAPGIRGKLRLVWMSRIILSLFIGAVIIAVQFSRDWASAGVEADVTYKSFSSALVRAELGLHVGLSGVNVTLRGNPVVQRNETINYNEAFHWTDNLEQDYAEALERGLPSPILYVADKFRPGSPSGLHYQHRFAGRYASATMWTAFCCWLLANILFSMPVLLYAGCVTVTAGLFMFLSLASFAATRSLPACLFAVGSASFQTRLGCSFWLVLGTGVLCTVVGVLVVILDCMLPKKMSKVFSVAVDDGEEERDAISGAGGYLNKTFLRSSPPLEILSFTGSERTWEAVKPFI